MPVLQILTHCHAWLFGCPCHLEQVRPALYKAATGGGYEGRYVSWCCVTSQDPFVYYTGFPVLFDGDQCMYGFWFQRNSMHCNRTAQSSALKACVQPGAVQVACDLDQITND